NTKTTSASRIKRASLDLAFMRNQPLMLNRAGKGRAQQTRIESLIQFNYPMKQAVHIVVRRIIWVAMEIGKEVQQHQRSVFFSFSERGIIDDFEEHPGAGQSFLFQFDGKRSAR